MVAALIVATVALVVLPFGLEYIERWADGTERVPLEAQGPACSCRRGWRQASGRCRR